MKSAILHGHLDENYILKKLRDEEVFPAEPFFLQVKKLLLADRPDIESISLLAAEILFHDTHWGKEAYNEVAFYFAERGEFEKARLYLENGDRKGYKKIAAYLIKLKDFKNIDRFIHQSFTIKLINKIVLAQLRHTGVINLKFYKKCVSNDLCLELLDQGRVCEARYFYRGYYKHELSLSKLGLSLEQFYYTLPQSPETVAKLK
jgi:hypothetical protein